MGGRFRIPGTNEEIARYECRGCGASFSRQHHVCPECAGFCVDPVEDVERSH